MSNEKGKGIPKAWLFIAWMISQLCLIGIMIWVDHFAYRGDHIKWDPYWVVPIQWSLFVFIIGVQVICVALLIFPREWFVRWAEKEIATHRRTQNT